MKDWAQREAEKLGTTPADALERLIQRTGGKLVSMEIETGIAYQFMSILCRRYGVSRQDVRAFEYDGVTATMTDHCIRYGLQLGNVQVTKQRRKLTGPQALDFYLSGQCKKRGVRK